MSGPPLLPTPLGEPSGSGSTVGPSMSTLDKPNQSSQAKSKKTARDDRDFGDPNSLRGIIHALEESQNNSDRRIDNILSSIQQLAHQIETRPEPSRLQSKIRRPKCQTKDTYPTTMRDLIRALEQSRIDTNRRNRQLNKLIASLENLYSFFLSL